MREDAPRLIAERRADWTRSERSGVRARGADETGLRRGAPHGLARGRPRSNLADGTARNCTNHCTYARGLNGMLMDGALEPMRCITRNRDSSGYARTVSLPTENRSVGSSILPLGTLSSPMLKPKMRARHHWRA